MPSTDPVADAEELLDLLMEHRRAKVAAIVRASPMTREFDLPALGALQGTIEMVQRVIAEERGFAGAPEVASVATIAAPLN